MPLSMLDRIFIRQNLNEARDYPFDECHHRRLHAIDYNFINEDRVLDCPICSGLPPWEWEEPFEACAVECVSLHYLEDEPRYGHPSCRPNTSKSNEKYQITYRMYSQKSFRHFKATKDFWDECRKCEKFRKVAKHRLDVYPYDGLSICRSCRRKEDEEISKMDVKTLINKIKRRVHERST